MLSIPVYYPEPKPVIEQTLSGNSKYYDEIYHEYEVAELLDMKYASYPKEYWINGSAIKLLDDLELTTQENFESITLPTFYNKNLEILQTSFEKELFRFKNYLEIPISDAKLKFNETASIISELPFQKATVELTQSNSIKFTLLFPEDKLLLITKTLTPLEGLNELEIIFSFFIKRELILSNVSDTSTFMEGFKEFLSL